eukprot:scaffold8311_cov63-Cyclotella_meneghiniana.AAC.4
MIHITESSNIDCRLCKRFRGVTDIFIYSLVKLELVTIFGDEGVDIAGDLLSIDHETTIRSVPFLSMMMMGLPKLERVFFGGVSNDQAQVFDGDDSDEDSDDDERGGENKLVPYVDYPDRDFIFQDEQPLMTGLIDSMAGAFKVGALSPNLIIKGLRCLNDGNEECQACRHACESFPLESVACFECRGSSKDQIKSGRSFDLDVCLKREEVEKIFLSRNGSIASLYSKDRLLRILSTGVRVTPSTSPICIVHFSDSQLEDIGRVITHLDDVSSLESAQISKAIMKPFSKYDMCLLARKSRKSLTELGLHQNVTDIEGCFIKSIELIASEDLSENRTLLHECLSVVCECLYATKNGVNEIVQDAYAFLDALRQFLRGTDVFANEKSAEILTLALLRYGVNTKKEWASIIGHLVSGKSTQHLAQNGSETEAILFLVGLLKHANTNKGSSAFYILTEIIKREKNESIRTIVAGGIGQLVPYIAQDTRRTLSALSTIARSSKGHCHVVFGLGIVQAMGNPHTIVYRSMTIALDKCFEVYQDWVLLIHAMTIDEEGSTRVLQIVESRVIYPLIQSMNKYATHAVAESIDILAEVITIVHDITVLGEMVEAGAIPVLVQFVCPTMTEYAQKALTCLKKIIEASQARQNTALGTDLFSRVCVLLVTNSCSQKIKNLLLSLVYSMTRCSEHRKELVQTICAHPGAIRALVDMMTSSSTFDDLMQCSIGIMSEILIQENTEEVIKEAVAAGIIKNSLRCICEARSTDIALQILCMILEKLNQEHVDNAVRSGAINVLATLIEKSNGFSSCAKKALQTLSYISQFAADYRNNILKNHRRRSVAYSLYIPWVYAVTTRCWLRRSCIRVWWNGGGFMGERVPLS